MTTGATGGLRPVKGIGMEGFIATWYAKNTGKSLAEFRDLAKRLARELRPGDLVLEVAPGPGYLAIELARAGQFRITGLDISRTFVRIAKENARKVGVDVDFRQGNASALPFAANWFDFIVSRAAFKNFGDPIGALNEMHRVLRPGGVALIVDMRKDASHQEIAEEVAKMNLGVVSSFVTRATLEQLRRRAYTREDLVRMLAQTPFGLAAIDEGAIGFEIWMTKRPTLPDASAATAQ
jgi:ubiquinone/menaquinone biosynthesis C-methylase UbiE